MPACPLCGGDDARVLARGGDVEYHTLPGRTFTFFRCAACGHGYLDPLPAPEELAAIYPPTYYTVNPRSPVRLSGRLQDLKLRRDVARIRALAAGRPVRSVVDLGCGDAERLERLGDALSEEGGEGNEVELVGIDLQPDPERVRALAARGVRLVRGNIEEDLDVLRDGGHDFAVLCQILEHVRDPVGVLARLAGKLAPGGRVLVETPNLGGLDFRLFGRRSWGAYHTPRHFHLFTARTLARTAERAGLRALDRGFLPSGFTVVSLRNALGLDSVARSQRFGEFLNLRSWPVVALTSGLEMVVAAAGFETSNQYLLAERPA